MESLSFVLDTRPFEAFMELHPFQSCHIPIDQLSGKMFLLAPRGSSLDLVVANEQSGPESFRAWSSNRWLSSLITSPISPRSASFSPDIPPPSALDLAAGSCRDAVWLAASGWDVTAVDVDPSLLEKGVILAEASKTHLKVITLDLEKTPLEELPHWQFDLVHVSRYLHRPLYPWLESLVAPGGHLLYSTFMHPSHGKPRRERFLLKDNELKEVFPSLSTVHFEHTHLDDGRPFQVYMGRKELKKDNPIKAGEE